MSWSAEMQRAVTVLIRLVEFVFSDSCQAEIYTPDYTIRIEKIRR